MSSPTPLPELMSSPTPLPELGEMRHDPQENAFLRQFRKSKKFPHAFAQALLEKGGAPAKCDVAKSVEKSTVLFTSSV